VWFFGLVVWFLFCVLLGLLFFFGCGCVFFVVGLFSVVCLCWFVVFGGFVYLRFRSIAHFSRVFLTVCVFSYRGGFSAFLMNSPLSPPSERRTLFRWHTIPRSLFGPKVSGLAW